MLGLNTPVTVYERSHSVTEDGFSAVVETSSSQQLIIQPIDGREVERLTQGKRTSAGLLMHGLNRLPLNGHVLYKQAGDAAARRWLVVYAPDWKDQGGFYEAIGVAD